MQGSKAVQEIAMAQPQGRRPEPVGSGSTNRGFATLDPERQGAPPRPKAPAPRGPQLRPAPGAPAQRQRVEREEPEDVQAEP